MIRNTALLTLLVFTFNLFTPMFMQPKEAEANPLEFACSVAADVKHIFQTDEVATGVIIVVIGYFAVKGCEAGLKLCEKARRQLFTKCNAMGTRGCNGADWQCPAKTPDGCGDTFCYCQKDVHDKGISECTNTRCNNQGKYRNCVGHTCTSDIISPYSSSGYW